MNNPIHNKVAEWASLDVNEPRIGYEGILSLIDYLADNHFNYYEPTNNPNFPEFIDRLNSWIENSTDANQQKTFFRLVPHLFYVGRDDFDSLYRSALNYNIAKWLIEKENIAFTDAAAKTKLDAALGKTWFCPITDSMRINAFYHINSIHNGLDYRPDWRSLGVFGSQDKIKDYIQKNQICHIVLLEDFVGSGSQMVEAAPLAQSLDIPVLFLPLIVCPMGKQEGEKLQKDFSNITFSSVICIPDYTFVSETHVDNEPALFADVRELIKQLHYQVCGQVSFPHYPTKPYGPFGYLETGGLVVLYSNCPDNTLPIIHQKYDTWNPLFPRSTRV